uniref:Uncharacterized protein n=1 Tax=Vitis vinifera TaxID=29760 RepID=A5BH33_VITVI|nr:hypothetical protein VITISV_009765 [Vitis vinifera]
MYYRKVQKSRRDKHIYNHYLGRKWYARFEQDILQAERDIGRIDRSFLWNKAREKKGKFNKIIEPMINMIDELLEKAKETGLPPPSPNDIFCQALGKLDHPGRVVIKCKLAVERKGNVVAIGTLIEEK